MCEAENDLTTYGEVELAICEFCGERADECECGDGE